MLKIRFNTTTIINGNPNPFSLLHDFHRVLHLSTSSSTETTRVLSNYLINSLGFSEHQSLSTCSKLTQGRVPKSVRNLDFQKNAQSVITFLEQNGLDQTQIRKSVFSNPRVLFSDVGKTLKPKIELLKKVGFSGSDLAHVVSVNSILLRRRLGPAIEALRDVLGSDEDIVNVVKRTNHFALSLLCKYLIRNVELLRSYGVPIERIRKVVVLRPMAILKRTESLPGVLVTVKEKWGIAPSSPAFIYAVELLKSSSESTIESKCRILRSFGWTETDIVALIRQNAHCLASSEARIRNSLEFLMVELGYEPAYLASHSNLLTYSVERRLLPRHKVLRILKDKGLVKKDYTLYSATLISESKFLKKFIEPFKEGLPHLHEVYQQRPHVLPRKQGREDSQESSPKLKLSSHAF